MVVDDKRHEIKIGSREVYLAPKEWEILQALRAADGEVLSREMILVKIYGAERFIPNPRVIDIHIMRLRQKLKLKPGPIVTVPNYGYKFKA